MGEYNISGRTLKYIEECFIIPCDVSACVPVCLFVSLCACLSVSLFFLFPSNLPKLSKEQAREAEGEAKSLPFKY